MKLRNIIRRVHQYIIHHAHPVVYHTIGHKYPKYLGITTQQALEHLNSIHPDHGGSCLCSNNIRHDYDLHIIVPVYNVAPYVLQCLQSIVQQITNYTVLVTIVNDGSTDDSAAIVHGFLRTMTEPTSSITLEFVQQTNQGPAIARNTALQDIRGRYLMFVDSDDMLMPNAIQSLMHAAMRHDADIAQGLSNRGSTHGFAWGKVIKSQHFSTLCFPSGYWFEDTIIALFLYPLCHNIIHVKGLHYYYRYNTTSIMNTYQGNPKVLDSVWVSHRVLTDYFSAGHPATEALYHTFLEDALSTWHHLSTLQDESILQSLFVLQRNIAQQYFSQYLTTSSPHQNVKHIHLALQTGNYRMVRCGM